MKKGGGQPGNKNAKRGTPPIRFTDEYINELGNQMITWLNDIELLKTSDDPKDVKKYHSYTHLSQFYIPLDICRSEWEVIIKRVEFREYYEKAIEWMGNKMLTNPTMPTAYGSRFLGIYMKEVRKDEEALKDAEMERKKKLIDYEMDKKHELDKKLAPNDPLLTELLNALKSQANIKLPGSE